MQISAAWRPSVRKQRQTALELERADRLGYQPMLIVSTASYREVLERAGKLGPTLMPTRAAVQFAEDGRHISFVMPEPVSLYEAPVPAETILFSGRRCCNPSTFEIAAQQRAFVQACVQSSRSAVQQHCIFARLRRLEAAAAPRVEIWGLKPAR